MKEKEITIMAIHSYKPKLNGKAKILAIYYYHLCDELKAYNKEEDSYWNHTTEIRGFKKKWELSNDDVIIPIIYCPFCSRELEKTKKGVISEGLEIAIVFSLNNYCTECVKEHGEKDCCCVPFHEWGKLSYDELIGKIGSIECSGFNVPLYLPEVNWIKEDEKNV